MAILQYKDPRLANQFWYALERGLEDKAIDLIRKHDLIHCVHQFRHLYPLSAAAQWGLDNVCRVLLAAGANPNSEDMTDNEDTPLLSVIFHGHNRKHATQIFEILLRAGAELNLFLPRYHGATAFLLACQTPMRDFKGKIDIMGKYGARLEATDYRGRGALHYAAQNNADNIRTLLRMGCAANIQDDDGNTPLHLAAEVGSPTTFKAMLAAGVDPRVRNNKGLTALDCRILEADQRTDPREEMVARWIRRQLIKEARQTRNKAGTRPVRVPGRKM